MRCKQSFIVLISGSFMDCLVLACGDCSLLHEFFATPLLFVRILACWFFWVGVFRFAVCSLYVTPYLSVHGRKLTGELHLLFSFGIYGVTKLRWLSYCSLCSVLSGVTPTKRAERVMFGWLMFACCGFAATMQAVVSHVYELGATRDVLLFMLHMYLFAAQTYELFLGLFEMRNGTCVS